jgi:hypothetical protein
LTEIRILNGGGDHQIDRTLKQRLQVFQQPEIGIRVLVGGGLLRPIVSVLPASLHSENWRKGEEGCARQLTLKHQCLGGEIESDLEKKPAVTKVIFGYGRLC